MMAAPDGLDLPKFADRRPKPAAEEPAPVLEEEAPQRPSSRRVENPLSIVGQPARLRLINPAFEWQDEVPRPREWLVPNWIPKEPCVGVLSGDGGLGKSLLALDLAASIVLGERWLDMEVSPRLERLVQRVLVVMCEDSADEAHRRLHSIVTARGRRVSELDGLRLLCRAGEVSDLVSGYSGEMQVTDFYEQLRTEAAVLGQTLIVLDSLHNLYPGNENSRTDVAFFMTRVMQLALAAGCPVLLVAHPSLSGRNSGTGEAGSTAWRNSARAMMYLTKPSKADESTDPNLRLLHLRKSNYGPVNHALRICWQNGTFVRVGEETGIKKLARERAVERAYLSCVEEAYRQGRHVSRSPSASNFAPKVFASMPLAEGCSARELRAAQGRLFASGDIQMGGDLRDPGRHSKQTIVRSGPGSA